MTAVIAGVINKLDRAERVVAVGSVEMHLGEGITTDGLAEGVSVSAIYEERDGRLWALSIRPHPRGGWL